MAEAETNWIDFFVSLAPVAQTVVWAGVTLAVLVTLKQPLKELAEGLVARVNRGDRVTTPWLSLERLERESKVVEQVTRDIRAEILPLASAAHSSIPFSESELDVKLSAVKERFITIIFKAADFMSKTGDDVRVSLYMTPWSTVSAFLNDVYFAASDHGLAIPTYSYGIHWQLRNDRTQEVIEKVRLRGAIDTRPFDELDIVAGDTLRAERVINR